MGLIYNGEKQTIQKKNNSKHTSTEQQIVFPDWKVGGRELSTFLVSSYLTYLAKKPFSASWLFFWHRITIVIFHPNHTNTRMLARHNIT